MQVPKELRKLNHCKFFWQQSATVFSGNTQAHTFVPAFEVDVPRSVGEAVEAFFKHTFYRSLDRK